MHIILRLLLTANGCINFSLGMFGPIYALFVEEIGGDVLDASWAFALYMVTAGIVTFLLGKWEDRYEYKEMFVFSGYMLLSCGFLLYVFVDTQFLLLCTQVLLGLGIAVAAPSFDALYSEHTNKHKEASEWGAWESLNSIVLAVSAVVGGYVVTLYNFQLLFFVMAGVSFVGACVVFGLHTYLKRA